MAEASSSKPEPKSLRQTRPTSDDDDGDARQSSSTASHRYSYYDQQRIGRRSRPQSGGSYVPSGHPGRRSSYTQPANYANITEDEVPMPSQREPGENREQETSLEQYRSRSPKPKPAAKDARQAAPSNRQRESAQDMNVSEAIVPPPVASSAATKRTSASTKSQQRRSQYDAERGEDADTESSSPSPPPFVQRRPEEYVKKRKTPDKAPKWLTEIYTISYLIFFSILGTLARLGVQWLSFYPGAPVVTPVLWANMAGSLIIGFLAEDQQLFRDEWSSHHAFTEQTQQKQLKESDHLDQMTKAERAKHKKTIPLYIGLAVGFCGSFTSFSSFARDAFLALSSDLPTPLNHPAATGATTTSARPRHNGYSVEAVLAVILLTLALSHGGLIVGAHLALALEPITPRLSIRLTRRFIDPLIVFLAFGCWLGAILLSIFPPDRPTGPASKGTTWSSEAWRGQVLFALVFAPLGCLLRFYASLKLNGLVPSFPLGTFAVNMLGTAIEGMCWDVMHVGVTLTGMPGGGRVGCQVLQGVADGFCGCLTTVSTWVAEINGLRRRHGYLYALASVVGGVCLMVVIMGSVRWSVG